MLPLELLSVVFGFLSRADLEALMLVNAVFRELVLRNFAAEPFRHFTELCVFEHRYYEFDFTDINSDGTTRWQWYISRDDDDFRRRMRLSRVGSLEWVLNQMLSSQNN